jgi:hypothetical protein
MAKNSQTQTSSVDPGTRAYIEDYRRRAQALPGYQTGMQGIEAYQNPFQQQVIGQIQAEGTRQAGFANMQAADQATRAGAYGGSREAVLRAQMMGDVQRQTGQNVAQYTASGYEDAANRMMQDRMNAANVGFGNLNALRGGMTPTTETQTMEQKSSIWPQLLGIGMGIGGMALGGPPGAAAGYQIGSGLGGGFSGSQGRVAQGGGLNFGGLGNLGMSGGWPQQYGSWYGQDPWGD